MASHTEVAHYAVEQVGDVVSLRDGSTDTRVSVLTSLSNACELVVKGQHVIRQPFETLDEFRAHPGLNGIPLLAPFANRLDEPAFYANGSRYPFDLELGNVHGPIPIHGFLNGAVPGWQMVEAKADGNAAWVTSTLDFYRHPAYMKQFPFAHTITMTYRLEQGTLEVDTRLDNLSTDPMPVAIGFHPYFQLTDSNRDAWVLSVGGKTEWLLGENKIPTGETRTADIFLKDRTHVALEDVDLDHVFSDLDRDAHGRATMSLRGKAQRLDVMVGPKYRAIVLYSPRPVERSTAPRGFVAIEPMAGITNAMNAAHKGLYNELQCVPPGGSWQESFWVRPTGF